MRTSCHLSSCIHTHTDAFSLVLPLFAFAVTQNVEILSLYFRPSSETHGHQCLLENKTHQNKFTYLVIRITGNSLRFHYQRIEIAPQRAAIVVTLTANFAREN